MIRPAAAALLLAVALTACSRRDAALVGGHGTVEVAEADIAPLVTARLLRVLVDEGDQVEAGDTVAILTQSTLAPNLEAGRARVWNAEAVLRDLRQGSRPAELERAEAEVAAAEAEAVRTARDQERMHTLAARQVVSQQQLDAATSAAGMAAGRLRAARESLRLLREGSRPERIRAAEADVASSRAALGAIEAVGGDLVLFAPVGGIVLGRWAEPGEVMAAGMPVVTVGEIARPWVRVYLPAGTVAALRVGQPARVTLDGLAGRDFAGRIAAVNPRAEFTPRAALTEEERADLLFGVRVDVADTTGAVKPGLPATVELSLGATQ
jgi:HlyD family secretion protein